MNLGRVLLLVVLGLVSVLLVPAVAADMHIDDRRYTHQSGESSFDDRSNLDTNGRQFYHGRYYDKAYDNRDHRSDYDNYQKYDYYRRDGQLNDAEVRTDRFRETPAEPYETEVRTNRFRETRGDPYRTDAQRRGLSEDREFRSKMNTESGVQSNQQRDRRRTRPVPDGYSEQGYFADDRQRQGNQPTQNQDRMQGQAQQRAEGRQQQNMQEYEGFLIMRPAGNETGQWQVFRIRLERLQDSFAAVFGDN